MKTSSRWLRHTCTHIVQDHPFIDGNKRTGAVAAIVFFAMNDIEVDIDEDELENLVRSVAEGTASKSEVADLFRRNARRRNPRGR